MKIFKYFCKTALILLFIICCSLIISSKSFATTGWDLNGRRNVYCMEHQQHFQAYASNEWVVRYENTLTSDDGQLAHAFAYIAYYGNENGAYFDYLIGYNSSSSNTNKNCQGAMWRLAEAVVANGQSNKFFGGYVSAVGGSGGYGKNLYNQALNDYNSSRYKYTVSYKIWCNTGKYANYGQALVEVVPSREEKTPTVKLEFYKKDRSGNNLDSTSLDVIKWDNCKSISGGDTIEGGVKLLNSSETDGKIGGTVGITPENNTGSLTIKIHEYPKDGYIGITDKYFKVDYNKSSGDVTSIKQWDAYNEQWVNPDADYFTITSGKPAKITITNDRPLELPLYKKDTTGKSVSGVSVSVTSDEGVKSLDTSKLKTSTTDGSLGKVLITPNSNSGTLKINITENNPPVPYVKMPGTATLTINYDKGTITSITPDTAHSKYFNYSGNTLTLKNDKVITLPLKKVSKINADVPIENVGIKISDCDSGSTQIKDLIRINSGGEEFWGLKSDSNGEFGTIQIIPGVTHTKGGRHCTYLKIEEKSTPTGIQSFGTIYLRVYYDLTTYKVTGVEQVSEPNNVSADIISGFNSYVSYDDDIETLLLLNDLGPTQFKIKKVFKKTDAYGSTTTIKYGDSGYADLASQVQFHIYVLDEMEEYPKCNGQDVTTDDTKIFSLGTGEFLSVTNIKEDCIIYVEEYQSASGYAKQTTIPIVEFTKQDTSWNINNMSGTIDGDIITFTNRRNEQPTPLEFPIYKYDTEGNPVKDVKISVEKASGSWVSSYTIEGTGSFTEDPDDSSKLIGTSDDDGYFGTIKIIPPASTPSSHICIGISEIYTPYDYIPERAGGTIEIDFNDGEITNAISLGNYTDFDLSDGSLKLVITNKKKPMPEYYIHKVDKDNPSKLLPGAEFKVTAEIIYMDKDPYTETYDNITSTSGKYKIPFSLDFRDKLLDAMYKELYTNGIYVRLTIEEVQPPSGYDKVEGTITISTLFNGEKILKNRYDYDSDIYKTESGKNKIIIKNQKSIDQYPLKIHKDDLLGNALGAGYVFKISIPNAQKIEVNAKYIDTNHHSVSGSGQKEISGQEFYLKTDASGIIDITKIYAEDKDSDITVEEISVPANSVFEEIPETELFKTRDASGNVVLSSVNTAVIKTKSEDSALGDTEVKVFEPLKDFTVNINKTGADGELLDGVTFDVLITNDENETIYSGTRITANGGKIVQDINLNEYIGDIITVQLTETATVGGYLLPAFPNNVFTASFKYKYDSTNKTGKYVIDGTPTNCTATISGATLDIDIENKKVLPDINLVKKDSLDGSPVEGATFTIQAVGVEEVTYNENTISKTQLESGFSATSAEDGTILLEKIIPAETSTKSTVTFTVEEITAPNGLKCMDGEIKVEFDYDPSTGTIYEKGKTTEGVTLSKDLDDNVTVSYNKSANLIEIIPVDQITIEELNLVKTDSVTGERLKNAEFKLEFTNVSSLKVHENCVTGMTGTADEEGYLLVAKANIPTTTFKTNNGGLILLKDIALETSTAQITITETKPAPTDGSYYYAIPKESAYFNITYNGVGLFENGITVEGPYTSTGKITQGSIEKNVEELIGGTAANYSLNVTFGNIPLMDLKGQVWLDEQQASKDARPRDGVNNDSAFLPKVKVYLFEQRSGEAKEIKNIQTSGKPDSNSIDYSTNRNSGKYEFIELESPRADYSGDRNTTLDGYIVKFEYNGIDYENTEYYKDNSGNIRKNSEGIEYNSKAKEYGSEDEFARDVFNSRFKTIGYEPDSLGYRYYDGGADLLYNHGITNNEYHIWGENPTNRDRNFKVRAKTELQTGTDNSLDFGMVERFFDLEIVNIVENVKYSINKEEWTEDPEGTEGQAPTDNVCKSSIFYSDYNYRIDDYKATNDSTDAKENKITTGTGDPRSKFLDKDTELQIEIKNKLRIKNSTPDKEVESVEVEYTYDSTCDYIDFKPVEGEGSGTSVEPSGENKLTIILKGKDITEGIYLNFIMKKDNQETRNLPEAILTKKGLDVDTTAEIISYTTATGGYIDEDSEPGNGEKEDDIQSNKITFTIKEEEREISGSVAVADSNTPQKLSNENINDVIVQLIEIVDDDEYIWQETKTGSGHVKARDGKTTNGTYEYDLTVGNGEYKFIGKALIATDDYTRTIRTQEAGLIPGNYIVRFIYGDGTTYDLTNYDVFDNVTNYNGQDYKSTIDKGYHEPEYGKFDYTEDGNITEKISKARDNEARRLQVMAFSTTMDGALGEALNTVKYYNYNDLSETQRKLLKEYQDRVLTNNSDLEVAYIKAICGYNEGITTATPLSADTFKVIQKYVLYKTWMCAETSKIHVTVEGNSGNPDNSNKYINVNLGLTLRPRTQLTLEKHITGLKISPSGVGAQSVVDAKVDNLEAVLQGNPSVTTTGTNNHLKTFLSTRGNRGSWYVETDTDQLMRGGQVEAQYTYVIRNTSEADYLSSYLVAQYESGIESGAYVTELTNKANEVKLAAKRQGLTSIYGTYLGTNYYTGNVGSDAQIPSRVNIIEEALNNDFKFTEKDGTNFVAIGTSERTVYNSGGHSKDATIDTVIRNRDPYANFLVNNGNFNDSTDYSKTVTLVSTLNPGNPEIELPSYIAEIIEYTNAAGRRDTESTPGNLEYVHSEDNEMTLDAYRYRKGGNGDWAYATLDKLSNEEKATAVRLNEVDEFWAETIIVSKPTGEDKAFPVTLVAVISSSVILLGAGIILIKKYAIKNKA